MKRQCLSTMFVKLLKKIWFNKLSGIPHENFVNVFVFRSGYVFCMKTEVAFSKRKQYLSTYYI